MDIQIEPEMLIGIMQQDHPKEYALSLQKATIIKQGELIDQLTAALGASNGEQVQS